MNTDTFDFYSDDEGIKNSQLKLENIISEAENCYEGINNICNKIVNTNEWIGNGKEVSEQFIQCITENANFVFTRTKASHIDQFYNAIDQFVNDSELLEKGSREEFIKDINKIFEG